MSEGFARFVDQLVAGRDLADSEFGALSDLDRLELASLRVRWCEIPPETRILLLEHATELAEDDVELNFEAVGKVALYDDDPDVRERAVQVLWESEDRDVARRLAGLASEDTSAKVRSSAALGLKPFVERLVLGRLDAATGELITAALRVAVGDPDPDVRAGAVEASGPLPDEWVADAILDAYEGDDRDLRAAALRAMGASALDRWLDYISDQFYSSDLELRIEAVFAAGESASESLVEPLSELLADPDSDVVVAVLAALGEIGGEDAVEALREFAVEAPDELAEAVKLALEAAADGGIRRFGDPTGVRRGSDDEDDAE